MEILAFIFIVALVGLFILPTKKQQKAKADEGKCPYCGNPWDSKYTNHSTCGLE